MRCLLTNVTNFARIEESCVLSHDALKEPLPDRLSDSFSHCAEHHLTNAWEACTYKDDDEPLHHKLVEFILVSLAQLINGLTDVVWGEKDGYRG